MFLRFVVGSDGEDHRHLTGVITQARLLLDQELLSESEIVWLEEMFDWFNEKVPVPPYAASDWPDGVAAWFKAEPATEAIGKIWDVVALLREHGRNVRILRSTSPGSVCYEDEFQVVVSEFRTL